MKITMNWCVQNEVGLNLMQTDYDYDEMLKMKRRKLVPKRSLAYIGMNNY